MGWIIARLREPSTFGVIAGALLTIANAAIAKETVTVPGTDKGPVPHHRVWKDEPVCLRANGNTNCRQSFEILPQKNAIRLRDGESERILP